MELSTDPKSPAGVADMDDGQLPPLLSMIVEGLPPMRQSKYVHEAESAMNRYVERNGNIPSFGECCRVGLSSASYGHSGVISADRLVAISTYYAFAFLLDDVFFDDTDNRDDVFLDQYGIDHSARESPQKMQEYLDHLTLVFAQQQPLRSPATLIETMMCESGKDMLSLSNQEWFNAFVESLDDHYHTCVTIHADILAGHNSCIKNLEAFTVMRGGDIGGKFIQLLVEFGSNSYLPKALRTDPFLHKVTTVASIHIGFANDIYSYHKESSHEGNPRNLITVLMKCEGQSFSHTVRRAMELVNQYARSIVDMESEAWNPALQNHLQEIKALIAGNIYFSCMDPRYRQTDSVFSDLRDTTSSWKIVPHSEAAAA